MTDMGGTCECFCDYPPDFFRESNPRAKKEYICVECGETIKIGERYEYVAGKWEGYFDTFKTCAICSAIRKDLAPCSCFGQLDETLYECFGVELIEKGWRGEEE